MTSTRLIALLGASDTAAFLVTRRRNLRGSPGRAAGTLATLAAWLGLAARSSGKRRSRPRDVLLAATLAGANGAMLAIHVKHRILSKRLAAGPMLSWIALLTILRRR
ncbi:MAG: hypothetical protein ABR564_10160 [Candidatus Dormibacteria bacterium]